MKKNFCGRPGEDFFRHPHFRKQEYYFFGLKFEYPFLFFCPKKHPTFAQRGKSFDRRSILQRYWNRD